MKGEGAWRYAISSSRPSRRNLSFERFVLLSSYFRDMQHDEECRMHRARYIRVDAFQGSSKQSESAGLYDGRFDQSRTSAQDSFQFTKISRAISETVLFPRKGPCSSLLVAIFVFATRSFVSGEEENKRLSFKIRRIPEHHPFAIVGCTARHRAGKCALREAREGSAGFRAQLSRAFLVTHLVVVGCDVEFTLSIGTYHVHGSRMRDCSPSSRITLRPGVVNRADHMAVVAYARNVLVFVAPLPLGASPR